MHNKIRLDVYLVEKGLAKSRERARDLIIAGNVKVNGTVVEKPSKQISDEVVLEINENYFRYVSRGGYKLEKVLECFSINLSNKTCCDIGASTGGFTDCMLQYGAKKVYSIDVGHNQLDEKLLSDERVINLEGINFREIDPYIIKDLVDFATVDVSFISLTLVLPVLAKVLSKGGESALLIKPQFEAGREFVKKNGIVKDKKTHKRVIENVINSAQLNGFSVENLTYSPITGADGNIEFLIYLKLEETVSNNFRQDLDNLITQANIDLGAKH